MSRAPLTIECTFCVFCERGREQVPALVTMGTGCICSECVSLAGQTLLEHYVPIIGPDQASRLLASESPP